MIGSLRKKVRSFHPQVDSRAMEKNDHSIQITLVLYKWRFPTKNPLLQIPCVPPRASRRLTNASAYEIEKHWGKTAPPPEKLEFLSAKGGGIMTRPENWRHPDILAKSGEAPPPNTPGPLSQARALRQQITPRNYYADRRSPERVGTPPIHSATPFTNINMGQLSSAQRLQMARPTIGGATGGGIGGTFPVPV